MIKHKTNELTKFNESLLKTCLDILSSIPEINRETNYVKTKLFKSDKKMLLGYHSVNLHNNFRTDWIELKFFS